MPIQKFEVVLNTSNKDIEDVRRRVAGKLSSWLDDISFTTHKKEVCKSVKIIKT